MKTSDAINEISAALALAQAKMGNAVADAENPGFKRDGKAAKYADLAAVREASLSALNAQGIALLQVTGFAEGVLQLHTRLVHKSGQWIEGSYPLPMNPNIQQAGSAQTYARRYGWSGICGLATEADDDGNAAASAKPNGNGTVAVQPGVITAEQAKTIRTAVAEVGADESAFLAWMKAPRIEDIAAADFQRGLAALNSKRAARA